MGASRIEINVQRLLDRCEIIANDETKTNWRLEFYVNSLDKMLKELNSMHGSSKPDKDKMADYVRRCNFLKVFLQTTQLADTCEKVVAAQLLSHGIATSVGDKITKEIHQKTTAKYNSELRAELLGSEKGFDPETTIRSRANKSLLKSGDTSGTGEDLDVLIKYHHSMQEKIAEDMLSLTRNLKEQTELASSIIKKDTEIVGKSARLTDQNFNSLKAESEILAEHNKRAWKCSLWLMIGLVIMVFISMVMFMKMFKKRTY